MEAGENSDALHTLLRKTGNCIGHSNLAIALLRASDIPSRSVHGFLYREQTESFDNVKGKVSLRTGRSHRWIEIYYPESGWIQSDPIISSNFVHPDHIVLSVDLNENTELAYIPYHHMIDLNSCIDLSIKKLEIRELDILPYPKRFLYSIIRSSSNATPEKGKRIPSGFENSINIQRTN